MHLTLSIIDKTLHVTASQSIFGTGALYNAGGLCPVFMCVTTNKRSETPNISTVGFSNLVLSFDYITNGKLQWDDVGEIYDQAIIEGDTYNFKKGLQNQINQMIAYFPDDEKAIRLYYDLVNKVSGHASIFFSEKTMPNWLSKLVGHQLRKNFLKYSKQTTHHVLSSLTANEKLISVLCAQCGNYGLTPKQSSFGIHALVITHYIDGAA